jgi:hypothetical protein
LELLAVVIEVEEDVGVVGCAYTTPLPSGRTLNIEIIISICIARQSFFLPLLCVLSRNNSHYYIFLIKILLIRISFLYKKYISIRNTFEIEATNQRYGAILNGKKIIPEFIGNRLTEGYIGIQNHDADSNVSFKNIRIKEI